MSELLKVGALKSLDLTRRDLTTQERQWCGMVTYELLIILMSTDRTAVAQCRVVDVIEQNTSNQSICQPASSTYQLRQTAVD